MNSNLGWLASLGLLVGAIAVSSANAEEPGKRTGFARPSNLPETYESTGGYCQSSHDRTFVSQTCDNWFLVSMRKDGTGVQRQIYLSEFGRKIGFTLSWEVNLKWRSLPERCCIFLETFSNEEFCVKFDGSSGKKRISLESGSWPYSLWGNKSQCTGVMLRGDYAPPKNWTGRPFRDFVSILSATDEETMANQDRFERLSVAGREEDFEFIQRQEFEKEFGHPLGEPREIILDD